MFNSLIIASCTDSFQIFRDVQVYHITYPIGGYYGPTIYGSSWLILQKRYDFVIFINIYMYLDAVIYILTEHSWNVCETQLFRGSSWLILQKRYDFVIFINVYMYLDAERSDIYILTEHSWNVCETQLFRSKDTRSGST